MSFSAVRFGQAEDKTDFPFSLAFGSPLPTSRSPFGENVRQLPILLKKVIVASG